MRKKVWVVTSLLAVIVGACGGGGISVGAPCNGSEQACSDNKEWNCESGKWKLAEDCNTSKTKCVVKSGGDADCE